MSQRQFLSTLIWLVLVNVLIKTLFIFGIDLQVQNQVGQEVYGHYFALLNLCYIFQIINDFGLQLLHATDTARHGRIRRSHWRTIIRLKLGLSLCYVMIIFAVANLLGIVFSWEVMIAMVISNILISWISVLRGGISGMAQYKTEAMISVLDKVFMIAICSFLFLSSPTFHIEWFVWAQAASFAMTALIAVVLTRKLIRSDTSVHPEETADVVITFKDAIPYCVAVLLMYIYTRADGIMLTKLLPDGARQAGVYAAGFRLLDAANMIAFLVTPLLIPMYARLQHDRKETNQLLHLASGLMIFMTVSIGFSGFWWHDEIMQACYKTSDPQWSNTFRWLILSHIPIGLMYVYGSYLTALGLLKSQNLLFVVMVILNIGVNLIMINRMGTEGAAMTALFTQGMTTSGLVILAYRYLGVMPDRKWTMSVILYLLIMFGSGAILSNLTFPWLAGCAIFLLISTASAFGLKLISWKKIKSLLAKREVEFEENAG